MRELVILRDAEIGNAFSFWVKNWYGLSRRKQLALAKKAYINEYALTRKDVSERDWDSILPRLSVWVVGEENIPDWS